jgi:uncharacterized protein YecT (DUF1311 family)
MEDCSMSTYVKGGGWVAAVLYGCLVLMLASPTQAASFDCAKAQTKVEHIICDSPEISKLDDELNAAYKAATQVKQQATAIKRAQKQWMNERNDCVDAGCVKRAYEIRILSLTGKQTSTGEGADTNKDAGSPSQNGQRYRFELIKGIGVPVCDAYLERLNTTKYEDPPFCDRPENDAVSGFARLNRIPLSSTEVHDLYPIISKFMHSANQSDLEWTDMDLQSSLAQTGQFRLIDLNAQYFQKSIDSGETKIWRYEPAIDIDNDGMPDNVEVWHGGAVAAVNGKCGREYANKYSSTGGSIMRQRQLAFVVTRNDDRLDTRKTTNMFAHPGGGYRLPDGSIFSAYHPIGATTGIFKYMDTYYFDTFFDSRSDYEDKRKNDAELFNTLGVFLHKDGKTRQVCEYLMTDNQVQ